MEDCCVEYRVYIPTDVQQDLGEHEDRYRSLLAEYLAYLSAFIGDYIWQNEPFRLAYSTKHGKPFKFTMTMHRHYTRYIAVVMSIDRVATLDN